MKDSHDSSKRVFFKPEDFKQISGFSTREDIASFANAKLEREGKVVYGYNEHGTASWFRASEISGWNVKDSCHKYKALLINIEPIETCKHPAEKLSFLKYLKKFRCECGVKLKPIKFEEVK